AFVGGVTETAAITTDVAVLWFAADGGPGFWDGRYGLTLGRPNVPEYAFAAAASGRDLVLARSTTGAFNGDAWLAHLTRDPALGEQVAYGGSGIDRATGVVVAPGGGFVLAGQTTSFGAARTDLWTARTGPDFSLAFDPSAGAHSTST